MAVYLFLAYHMLAIEPFKQLCNGSQRVFVCKCASKHSWSGCVWLNLVTLPYWDRGDYAWLQHRLSHYTLWHMKHTEHILT